MRALILFAHPVPDSFSASLHKIVVDTLAERGWSIDDCDLYAERFDPVLSKSERRSYHDVPENVLPVGDYVARLRNAEALILVFPVWIFGFPAILKGFFDRVCLPGVAFRMVGGKVAPNLQGIRKLAAVTTYGGTRMRAMLAGDPPRRVVTRSVRFYCQPDKMRYLALYDMNRATPDRLQAFQERIAVEFRSF